MENIYTLTGRFAELSAQYDEMAARLEETYIENGGEVTADTEEQELVKQQIELLRQQVLEDIIDNADSYAAIAKNKEAQKKVLEAEIKAIKEEQRKVIERYQAKVARLEKSVEFWKDNFDLAMQMEGREKIGGAKTDHKFSIYYTTTKAIDVDEDFVLDKYRDTIDDLVAALPAWLKVAVSVNKTELKKEKELPEGAVMVESRNLQIR